MKMGKNNFQIGVNVPYSCIDKKTANFLVADILHGNGNNYSNYEIEEIIKAFCKSRINEYYSNYKIIIMDSDSLSELTKLENVNGLIKENYIYLKRENVLSLKEGKIDIIRTIMHEIQHIKQNYMLENNEINYRIFLTLMEEIVSYKIGGNFYRDNYDYIFTEIDARARAEFELFEFLSEYCPDILSNEIEEMIDNIVKCEEDSLINYRTVNGHQYDLEELFDIIIKSNPSIVRECPILNFYYELDGTKVPLGAIIQRKSLKITDPNDLEIFSKIKKLDIFIINNRHGSKQNLKKDIDSIINLNDENNNEIIFKLNERMNNNNSHNINEIHDLLKIKVNTLKNHVNKTKIAAETYAKKFYMLFK